MENTLHGKEAYAHKCLLFQGEGVGSCFSQVLYSPFQTLSNTAYMSAQDLLATIVFEQSPPPGFFWAGGSDREAEGQWTYQYDGQLVSADQWKPGEDCR